MPADKHANYHFNFTVFDENTEAFLQDEPTSYLIYAYETCPKTGRDHITGHIVYPHKRHRSAVWNRFFQEPRAGYIKPCYAEDIYNSDYTIKECKYGGFFERGTRPRTKAEKGVIEKDRWKNARLAAVEGRFEDIDDDIYIRYQPSLKRIRREDGPKPADLTGEGELKVGLWIYGPPRTGKSRYARDNYPKLYLKGLNKWWDNYYGQDYVLIDDFAPEHAVYLTGYMKQWTDRYKFSAETKGGTIEARPKRIIITSNYKLEDCFHGVDLVALQARFEIKKF